MPQSFDELLDYGKKFSGLTPELETCLKDIAPVITPHLETVTHAFYGHLLTIPNTADHLEGRVEHLKAAHLQWLSNLFLHTIDAEFAKTMYRVGDIHVKVNLPIEFMSGSMTLINNQLVLLVLDLFALDPKKCAQALCAINAVTGLALMIMLMVMQKSYKESAIAEELEKFLTISGMSRSLFSNLANAYE
ncbi:MAG: protoglobin domain-containing protein [Methylovulum sp.]|nr:protoglobin domain-containing protein [Methylovulum sp.]